MAIEFPSFIDSSMMYCFRSCPRKFFLTYMEHWKPKSESIHLHAGKSFAEGIEAARRAFWEDGHSPEDSYAMGAYATLKSYGAVECPQSSAKSWDRTLGALAFYFDHYPLGEDGFTPIRFDGERRAIEFSFAEPLEFFHPSTCDPILYCGRCDAIGEFAGAIVPADEKTTSQLGATWAGQWELRGQFTGYVWATQKAGIPSSGCLVRGVSILKTKYETQQCITYRQPWEIERWMEQTLRDLDRMEQCFNSGWWDYSLEHACTEYGGCQFREICKMHDPLPWLQMYFEKRVWNPITREETRLDLEGNPIQGGV